VRRDEPKACPERRLRSNRSRMGACICFSLCIRAWLLPCRNPPFVFREIEYAAQPGSSRRERKKIAQDKPAARPRGRSPGNPGRSNRETKYAAQPRPNPPPLERCHPEPAGPTPCLSSVIPSEAFFSGAEGPAFAFRLASGLGFSVLQRSRGTCICFSLCIRAWL